MPFRKSKKFLDPDSPSSSITVISMLLELGAFQTIRAVDAVLVLFQHIKASIRIR